MWIIYVKVILFNILINKGCYLGCLTCIGPNKLECTSCNQNYSLLNNS